MLGKLFSLGTGAPSASTVSLGAGHDAQTQTFVSLESVQEDVHTRNLLFPDADALYQSRHGQVFPLSSSTDLPQSLAQHPFDDRGALELELRDVRVLIMQDALGSASSAALLYDSHAPAHAQEQQCVSTTSTIPGSGSAGASMSNAPESRKAPVSPRKSSTGSVRTQTDSPQPRQGAFDRRASLHGGRGQSYVETELQKAAREYREEVSTFSGCVFGNSELMAYKGTSTKVHIMPSSAPEQPRSEWRSEWSSMFGDGRGSVGRAKGNRFSQSYTSDTVSPLQAPLAPLAHQTPPRQPDRQKILITRLFPVVLPPDDADSEATFSPQGRNSEDAGGFPFPQAGDEVPKKKKPQPRQKRTPMYAVVLVVSLPQAPPNLLLTPHKSSGLRGPGSYTEQQDSFPSSYGSTKRSGWSSNYNDLTESAFAADVEDRIDALTQHWDIIMRTLTSLQSKVTTLLTAMLKCAAIATPDPYCQVPQFVAQRNPSLGPRRPEDVAHVKPPKSNARLIFLQPNSLAQDRYIAHQVEVARNRIVTGLGAARVATGQGRWGMWRDEVRSMVRLTGKKERENFFINLLTGFLATHTDWLLALSPVAYRKRHILLKRAKADEDVALSSRTIIVADDKMMARRLIFLLSAFLPTNQPMPIARAHRPSTAASGPTSNSPPSFIVPLFREESLRKIMNKRGVPRHSRAASTSAARGSGVPATLAHLSMDDGANRRADSDVARPVVIPVLASDSSSSRKSMAIATAIAPETLVPHFAPIVRLDEAQGAGKKASTTSTTIAEDLKRSLQRGDSVSNISQASSDSAAQSQAQTQSQASKWGSVISGLLTGKKTPPTTATTATATTQQSSREAAPPALMPPPSRRSVTNKPNKLDQMVEEATVHSATTESRPQPSAAVKVHAPERPRGQSDRQPESESTARLLGLDQAPDPTGAFVSAIKTTINEDDGVIDVEVPFPDFVTASETAVSSPSSSGYLSTPGSGGLESFEHASRMTVDGDLPLNVAGWLPRYHPDFALQAIPDQEGLMDTIKASLRAEPSPAVMQTTGNDPDRWVDVSSAIVANTMTNTVTRIRYRRLIRPKAPQERQPPQPGSTNVYGAALLTPLGFNNDHQLEEEFIAESVATIDDILAEAVDKVIGLNTDMPSTSQGTVSSGTAASQPTDAGSAESASQSLEVPREQCKTVVLSAPEAVIRTTIEATEREAQATPSGSRNVIIRGENESLLREAVRVWLRGIDMGH